MPDRYHKGNNPEKIPLSAGLGREKLPRRAMASVPSRTLEIREGTHRFGTRVIGNVRSIAGRGIKTQQPHQQSSGA